MPSLEKVTIGAYLINVMEFFDNMLYAAVVQGDGFVLAAIKKHPEACLE